MVLCAFYLKNSTRIVQSRKKIQKKVEKVLKREKRAKYGSGWRVRAVGGEEREGGKEHHTHPTKKNLLLNLQVQLPDLVWMGCQKGLQTKEEQSLMSIGLDISLHRLFLSQLESCANLLIFASGIVSQLMSLKLLWMVGLPSDRRIVHSNSSRNAWFSNGEPFALSWSVIAVRFLWNSALISTGFGCKLSDVCDGGQCKVMLFSFGVCMSSGLSLDEWPSTIIRVWPCGFPCCLLRVSMSWMILFDSSKNISWKTSLFIQRELIPQEKTPSYANFWWPNRDITENSENSQGWVVSAGNNA